ncbi:MAG: ExbD/TolR family protein [Myxococcota bacterium]|nr:ExbD/TolR family protein [Myxococcota bacterium]
MGMSSGGGGGARAPLSEINVTPLVDVMLVLLIIFMVTAPLLTAGVEVDLPDADAEPMPLEDEKLLLIIDAGRHVFIRVVGQEVEGEAAEPVELPYQRYDELRSLIQSNRLIQGADEVYIQADENVKYGFVAQVLAIVRQAGVEHVGLVTDPSDEGVMLPPEDAPEASP